MSPDRDPGRFDDDGREAFDNYDDDDAPRSIFSTLWFRALLTVLVLGVLAAVAVPYVLDFATSPTQKTTPKSATAATPAVPAATSAAPAAAGSSPAPVVTPAVPDSTQASTTPPAETARPKSEPPPAAKAPKPAAKPAPAKPVVVAKAAEPTKPAEAPKKAAEAPKVAEAPKAAESTRRSVKAAEASPVASAPKAPAPVSSGSYWVQVGAFKDADTAKRLAARLREQGFPVDEAPMKTAVAAPRPAAPTAPAPAAPPADRYEVLVSGVSAADVDAKLAPKGLKGESTGSGVVVRPSLILREAVSLSRDLADAGMSVQVRRVAGSAPPAAAPAVTPPPPPAPAGGETLHRVRVGGFPDRAAATAAMKKLEDKGFKPFIARGNE